jgi:hypothetical protein
VVGTGAGECNAFAAVDQIGVPSAAIAVPHPANAATTSTAPATRNNRNPGIVFSVPFRY